MNRTAQAPLAPGSVAAQDAPLAPCMDTHLRTVMVSFFPPQTDHTKTIANQEKTPLFELKSTFRSPIDFAGRNFNHSHFIGELHGP